MRKIEIISHLRFVLKFYYRMMGKKLAPLVCFALIGVGLEGVGINFALPILLGLEHENRFNQALKGLFANIGIAYNLTNLLILLNIIIILRCLFLLLQARYIAKITAEMQLELRNQLASKIFNMEYQSFLGFSSGYFNNILSVEVLSAVSSFSKFSSLVMHGIFALAYAAMALIYNPYLFMLCGIGIGALPFFKFLNAKTKNYSVQATRHSGYLQKFIIEALRHFKYLKATGTSPKILKHIRAESGILSRLSYKQELLSSVTQYAFEPLVFLFLSSVIIYYVGHKKMNIVELSIPLFMIYRAITYGLALQGNMRKFFGSWGSIDIIDTATKKLNALEERSSESVSDKQIPFDQPIVFHNVSFQFNNSEPILKKINLKIEPRSMVAFVGDSGAGKSTIVNLIIGLLEANNGHISVGNLKYSQINRKKLRENIGYIIQEDTIFHDSVYNNIVMWEDDEHRNRKLVSEAVKKAHIETFIKSLPKQYESMIGEGGINISGGQRQRICIARELYKNPEILIFDEATSSLDSNTEKEIQRNIDEFKGKKTIILIAHRISTIKNADKIYVLKNGAIAEEGDYKYLCMLGGEFAKIVEGQK